jgi:CPA2 family monovalent cation:H+ antiporter-2
VLAGIAVRPFTPGPTIADPHPVHLFAEIGVILLMFTIGMEFSLSPLLRLGRVAAIGGPLGIVLVTLLAVGAGRLLGWTVPESLVVGAALSVASTMVLMKFLLERGELGSEHGKAVVGIILGKVGLEHGVITRGLYDALLGTSLVTILVNALRFRRARPAR